MNPPQSSEQQSENDTPLNASSAGRNHGISDGLPPPGVLGSYEQAVKGSAKVILKMAKREQRHYIYLRWADWFGQFISMLIGKGFLWFLVYEATRLALNDKPAAAVMAGIAPIASVIYSTFFGNKREQNKK